MDPSSQAPTEPSDWRFDPLRDIDALLRCPICYEYLSTAVIIPQCSHNFCSLCIRRHLLIKRQCPICSKAVMDSDLCCNRLLDQLITSFKGNRQKFLDLLSTNSSAPLNADADETTISSPPFIVPLPPQLSQLPEFEESQFSDEDSTPIARVTNIIRTNPGPSEAGVTKSTATQRSSIRDSISNTILPKAIRSSLAKDPLYSGEQTKSPSNRYPSRSGGEVKRSLSLAEDDHDAIEDPLPDEHGSSMFGGCSAVCSIPERNQPAAKQVSKNENGIIRASETHAEIDMTVVDTPQGSKVTSATPSRLKPRPDQPPGIQHDLSSSKPGLSTPSCYEEGVTRKTGFSRTGQGGDTGTPSIRVNCPVCSMEMSRQMINSHLDHCLKPSSSFSNKVPKPSNKSLGASTMTSNTVKPLPKLPKFVFSVMKDKELKKKLKDHKLSAQGTRKDMINRLKEFMLQYNAQCDSLNPKKAKEIAAEVDKAEKERLAPSKGVASTSGQAVPRRKSSTGSDVDEHRKFYERENKDHYAKLISEVRERRTKGIAKETNSHATSRVSESVTPPLDNSTQLPRSSSRLVGNIDTPKPDLTPTIATCRPSRRQATPSATPTLTTPTQSRPVSTPVIHRSRTTPRTSATPPAAVRTLTTPTVSQSTKLKHSGTYNLASNTAPSSKDISTRNSRAKEETDNSDSFGSLSPIEDEDLVGDGHCPTTEEERLRKSGGSVPKLRSDARGGRTVLALESPEEVLITDRTSVNSVPESPTVTASSRSLRSHGKRKHQDPRIRYSINESKAVSSAESGEDSDFQCTTPRIRKKQRRF